MVRIRSPARSPARAAAVRGRTSATSTPSALTASPEQGFMLLPLGGARGVQKAHPVTDVLQTGDDRTRCREPDDDPGRDRELEVPEQEPVEHRQDLKEGRRLADPGRS